MSESSASGEVARAGRREWLGLVVLGLPTLLIGLDIGVLFLALPHLAADLDASSVEQLWIVDIYGFLLAGLLITMGTLGDQIGRRRLLLVGAALFGVLSVLAAYSTSAGMLIATRAVLGIAGATLMPSTLALITTMFRDPRQRGVAISAWMSCMMVGGAIGPVVGGVLLERFWWGSVFLLGVPVMVLLLVTGRFLLPESRNPNPGKLDLASVALSLSGILLTIYGLKELATSGGDDLVVPVLSILVGATMITLFLRRQLRLEYPLIDVSLFRDRVFRTTVLAMTVAAAVMAGSFLLASQYVQVVVGMRPGTAGLWLMSTGIAMATGTQLGPKLAAALPLRVALGICLACGAAGFALMSLVAIAPGPVPPVLGLAVVHFAVGPLFALGAGVIVSASPPERAGSAASISETANELGTTVGMAMLGTLGAFIYRTQIAGGMPSDVPEPAAAGSATESVAGAHEAAEALAPSTADALRKAADAAFTAGLTAAALIGAVLLIGLAWMIYSAQRSAPALSPHPADCGSCPMVNPPSR